MNSIVLTDGFHLNMLLFCGNGETETVHWNYNYNADWSWKDDGTKSHSVTNTVTGYSGCSRDDSYGNHCEYHYDYGFGCDSGYSCSVSDSCSTSCTTLDASDTISRTGWGYGSTGNLWYRPFSGRIDEGSYSGDECCDYSYSYNNGTFSVSNFSVSMTDETFNGTESESNEVWHTGRSSFYYTPYNDYMYSYAAPGSRIPGGSTPEMPSGGYGNVNFTAPPLMYAGNPNFGNFEFVDPEEILNEKCPKPKEPSLPAPAAPPETPAPPAAPATEDPTLSNRIFGALTAIGGIAEAAVGGIGFVTGIGTLNPVLAGGGGVVGLNGLDNIQAGMRQAISGRPVQTATSKAVESVTGSHLAGEGTNIAIGLVGPGAVAKMATGSGLFASLKSVGSGAWNGLKNTGSSIKNWWNGSTKVTPKTIPAISKEAYPKPPGWTSEWEWGPSTRENSNQWRWWDTEGGEWCYHFPDKYHPTGHWDYNPWQHPSDSWRNVY